VKSEAGGYPLTDLYTDEGQNQVIEMALAGFALEELSIEVKDNSITISCASDSPAGDPRRIARRAFRRSFVDYDQKLNMVKADATFENGLLQVVIPRVEETKPTTIDIQYK
jgi:HSP20 family molecular chaperone IbpA